MTGSLANHLEFPVGLICVAVLCGMGLGRWRPPPCIRRGGRLPIRPHTHTLVATFLGAANIFIGSLIFIEELADKIVQAVAPARDTLDACLVFPSMPAVMKLNKLGTFSMSQVRDPRLDPGYCLAVTG